MEEKELTFEEYLQKLEECAEKLKSPGCTLEESVKAYEEGQKLYIKCQEILNDAKGRVHIYRKEAEI